MVTRNEEWLRRIRFPYEGRVRFHFEKLVTRGCEQHEYEFNHLPHIWYGYEEFRRYFCRGWDTNAQ